MLFKKLTGMLLCILLLSSVFVGTTFAEETYEMHLNLYQAGYYGTSEDSVELFSINTETYTAVTDAIRTTLDAMSSETINIASYNLSVEETEYLLSEVINSDPKYFYVTNTLSYYYDKGTNIVTGIIPKYLYPNKAAYEADRALLDAEIDNILSVVEDGMSIVEKALAVHDYFAVTYFYTPKEGKYVELDSDTGKLKFKPTYHSVRSLFIEKTGVCSAYAQGYQLIMNKLGIPCGYVTSANLAHGWNVINISEDANEELWYYVDVTWDDPTVSTVLISHGYASHNFFLLTESEHTALRAGDLAGRPADWDAHREIAADPIENPFWQNSSGPMFYSEGYWYYVDIYYFERNGENYVGSKGIIKQEMSADSTPTVVFDAGGYYSPYHFMSLYEDKIYYCDPNGIYSLTLDGKDKTTILTPNEGYTFSGIVYNHDTQALTTQEVEDETVIAIREHPLVFAILAHLSANTVIVKLGSKLQKEEDMIVVGFYDTYGELVSLSAEKVSDGHELRVAIPKIANPSHVRVMAWNMMQPVDSAITLPLQNKS